MVCNVYICSACPSDEFFFSIFSEILYIGSTEMVNDQCRQLLSDQIMLVLLKRVSREKTREIEQGYASTKSTSCRYLHFCLMHHKPTVYSRHVIGKL